MKESCQDYLWRQIRCHASLFFKPEALALLQNTKIIFTSLKEAALMRGPSVVIPTDIPYEVQPQSPYSIDFNGTKLTLWHPIARPTENGWRGIPEDSAYPIWYRHDSGTHIPAWNLFGNLLGLLTFQEEKQLCPRDDHGRFAASFSPRYVANILEVPAFNEAVAVLIGACIGINENNFAAMQLGSMIKPPVVVTSHDCDILRGNDLWTQSIRALRIFMPLLSGKLPRIENLWWILRNAVRPRDFYFDNIPGMISLEKMFGCHSTFYLLNGTGGRFGARSGSSMIPELMGVISSGWDVGMHYNYDTFLDAEQFSRQREELSSLLDYEPVVGRAHYLRFDSEHSLPFWASQGILVDESAGYSDRIGYRCGIGGCFQSYDSGAENTMNIWELPMNIMDDTILSQYGDDALMIFEKLLYHLSKVGGSLSIIFHPGTFYNPEFPRMMGLYHKMLIASRDIGCRCETALSLYNNIPMQLRRV